MPKQNVAFFCKDFIATKARDKEEVYFAIGVYWGSGGRGSMESMLEKTKIFTDAVSYDSQQVRDTYINLGRLCGVFASDCMKKGTIQGLNAKIRKLENEYKTFGVKLEVRAMPKGQPGHVGFVCKYSFPNGVEHTRLSSGEFNSLADKACLLLNVPMDVYLDAVWGIIGRHWPSIPECKARLLSIVGHIVFNGLKNY